MNVEKSMRTYVVAKPYPSQTLFICGSPVAISFHYDVDRAARFDSVEDASDFRTQMPYQLGGGSQ